MIRHPERNPWLPLSFYLSDHAASISCAAETLGGPALAKLARSVIDDVRLGQEPTRRLIEAIERLCTELDERSKNCAAACSNTWQASAEEEFIIRAEISALVDEFRHLVSDLQLARSGDLTTYQRGVS